MVKNEDTQAMVNAIKARGWQGTARTVLDVLEPLAPLVSQLLWIAQPAGRIIGAQNSIHALANLLETAEGVAYLQAQLAESPENDTEDSPSASVS
ncbi:MAG: hypothetical protein AAF126_09025 [Chloroflexota bacterium]